MLIQFLIIMSFLAIVLYLLPKHRGMSNQKRWISFLTLLIAITFAVGLTQVLTLRQSGFIQTEVHGIAVTIRSDIARVVPVIQPCTVVSWEIDRVDGIFLNDEPILPINSKTFCANQLPAQLKFSFPDNHHVHVPLPVEVLTLENVIETFLIGFILTTVIFIVARVRLPHINDGDLGIAPDIRLGILVFIVAVFTGLALTLRFVTAFSFSETLTWDERYYASIAATSAHGYGLYPGLFGYPDIPVMGGIGQFARLYTLAYQTLGPSIFSLRVVVVFATLLAIAGFYFCNSASVW